MGLCDLKASIKGFQKGSKRDLQGFRAYLDDHFVSTVIGTFRGVISHNYRYSYPIYNPRY